MASKANKAGIMGYSIRRGLGLTREMIVFMLDISIFMCDMLSKLINDKNKRKLINRPTISENKLDSS